MLMPGTQKLYKLHNKNNVSRPLIYSSSMSTWRAVTFFWNSAGSLSHSSAASPFKGEALYQISILWLAGMVEGILVWLSKQTLETQEDGLDVVCRRPLILENIKTDPAGEVDIWVVNGRLEENSGRCVWVVGWEGKRQLQAQLGVWRVVWALDCCSPGEQVSISGGECRDPWSRGCHELHELCLKSKLC